jgi:hypothetical protein
MGKITWWIKGHLEWHTGKRWLHFQENTMREYVDSDLSKRNFVSAFEYWGRYSQTNGRM